MNIKLTEQNHLRKRRRTRKSSFRSFITSLPIFGVFLFIVLFETVISGIGIKRIGNDFDVSSRDFQMLQSSLHGGARTVFPIVVYTKSNDHGVKISWNQSTIATMEIKLNTKEMRSDGMQEKIIGEEELDRMHVKRESLESCKRYDWHSASFPTCNNIHEIDITNSVNDELKYLASGGVRDVWRLKQRYFGESVVIKLLRPQKDFSLKTLEMHRVDSLISEKLTYSKHVVDIFSYCAQSVTNERVKSTIQELNLSEMTSKEKLQTAQEMAFGLSEAHYGISDNFTEPEAVIVHRDITPKNFALAKNNVIKINDFNAGKIMDNCEWIKMECNRYRSPEECSGASLTEKVDVYALGHIYYYLLTSSLPRKTSTFVNPPIKELDEYTNESGDKHLQLLAALTKKCFSLDPNDRLTSRQVAIGFQTSLINAQS